MNIDETLAYIHTTDWRGTKPGLTRIRALLDLLGNPERQLKFVHVTGTNGKGSTCAMLASILHEAGLRTGLYTSPYIVRFNERIQVDDEQIPDDALCALTCQKTLLALLPAEAEAPDSYCVFHAPSSPVSAADAAASETAHLLVCSENTEADLYTLFSAEARVLQLLENADRT